MLAESIIDACRGVALPQKSGGTAVFLAPGTPRAAVYPDNQRHGTVALALRGQIQVEFLPFVTIRNICEVAEDARCLRRVWPSYSAL